MKKTLKKIYRFLSIRIKTLKQVPKIKEVVNAESYFPELKRKRKNKRYIDNLKWLLKYHSTNNFYNLYGMDIIDKTSENDYIDYETFMNQRNKLNLNLNTPKDAYNYIALLRDKYLFEKYMNCFNIPTAKTIAVIKNGIIYDSNLIKNISEKDLFEKKHKYFVKGINGECAEDVFFVDSIEKYNKLKNKFKNGMYIVQLKLNQHENINKLNPKSINTIRICTTNNKDSIQILCSGLRVGTNKSQNVDNWARGGIYIPINDNGKLYKYGFYKPQYGIKTDKHPDTKVTFEDYKIPYYEEVKKLVTQAHKKLYGIHSIGFDVAITDEGPVLIEGNDNWEISLMQARKGLKKEWLNSLKVGNNNEK